MSPYEKNVEYLSKTNSDKSVAGLSENYRTTPTVSDLIKLSETYGISIDQLVKQELYTMTSKQIDEIKFIVLDVDGVMTDGGMYYTESGDEFKKFNTKDGMAIKQLAKTGMRFGIISSGINAKLIKSRGELLGMTHVHVGKEAKLPILKSWCEELGISTRNVAFIGDDINDLEVIGEVGLSAAPSNAINSVLNKVDLILTKKGGEGCIREFIDMHWNY